MIQGDPVKSQTLKTKRQDRGIDKETFIQNYMVIEKALNLLPFRFNR